MANELSVITTTGLTIYAVGRVANRDNLGLWGNVSTGNLENFTASNWRKYATLLTELGNTGIYQADFPSVFNAEQSVDIIYLRQGAGGVCQQTDTKISGSRYDREDGWVPAQAIDV